METGARVQDDKIKAVVFGLGQGQKLSEHTAAKPPMLFFVRGEANEISWSQYNRTLDLLRANPLLQKEL